MTQAPAIPQDEYPQTEQILIAVRKQMRTKHSVDATTRKVISTVPPALHAELQKIADYHACPIATLLAAMLDLWNSCNDPEAV